LLYQLCIALLHRRPHIAFHSFLLSDTATTEIYTLSLHDALPISGAIRVLRYTVADECGVRLTPDVVEGQVRGAVAQAISGALQEDRKSTRLNSSHVSISYAVFCLKKKKNITKAEKSQCEA